MNTDKKLTGVSFDDKRRIKKYKAVIRINGVLKSLGYFRTEIEAHQAFIVAQAERDKTHE
jgi:hypothetical protein